MTTKLPKFCTLDSIEDAAAKDFGSQITKGLDKLPIWLGSFTRA